MERGSLAKIKLKNLEYEIYCVSQVEGVHSQSPAQDIIGDYSDTGTIPIKHKRTLTYTICAYTPSKTAQCIPIFVTSKSLIINLDNMTSVIWF